MWVRIDMYDNIRNILIIITTMFTIIMAIVRASDNFLIENVKMQYKSISNDKSLIQTILYLLFYIIIGIDILTLAVVIGGAIYECIKVYNLEPIKNIYEYQKESFTQDKTWNIVIIFIFLVIISIISALIYYYGKLKEQYINKLHNNKIKVKKYNKVVIWLCIVATTISIIVISVIMYSTIADIDINSVLALSLAWINALAIIVIFHSYNSLIDQINSNEKYLFVISKEDTIECNLYLEYVDYYMIVKNNNAIFIKKSEVKKIEKYIGGNNEVPNKESDKLNSIIELMERNSIKVIVIAIGIIFFAPILPRIKLMHNIVVGIFGSNESAIEYMQYFGTIVGGLATLSAVYITVIQTRKIQDENYKLQLKQDRRVFINEIESLVAQYITDIGVYFYAQTKRDQENAPEVNRREAIYAFRLLEIKLENINIANKLLEKIRYVHKSGCFFERDFNIDDSSKRFEKDINDLKTLTICFSEKYMKI